MRIRTVKPEFWRSDDVTSLSREHRLLFIGLWSYVDDNGVGIDDYRQIAADLFALEDDQKEVRDFVRDGLATLSRAFLVARYETDGKRYIFITGWDRHQRVDKPNKPRHPRPPDDWTPPTCDDAPPSDSLARPSRQSRDSLDTGRNRTGVNSITSDGAGGRPENGDHALTRGSRGSREGLAPGTEEQRNITTLAAAAASADTDGSFAAFWAAYPRKVKKQDAEKAWRQVLRRKVDPGRVVNAAKAHAARWRTQGKETQFVPYPATWLRAGSYDDEPEPARLAPAAPPDDPDAALAELRHRGDAATAARLVGATYIAPAKPPSDPADPRRWRHARAVEWIDAHADRIRAAFAERTAG